MKPFDLSIRYKIPLWGAMLVLLTAAAVSATLMHDAWEEVREDVQITAGAVSRTMLPVLADALQGDDVWRGYQTLVAPLGDGRADNPAHASGLLLIDADGRVFASTRPRLAPVMTPVAAIGPAYATLGGRIAALPDERTHVVDIEGAESVFYATPISAAGTRLGTLVLEVPRQEMLPRFRELALHGAFGGLLVLCILLPINWFWGQYMARPLIQLTEAMALLGQRLRPADGVVGHYPHRDELGQLFAVYNQMLEELRQRELLETQIVRSERLAAVGQLASGIAHEINNPLGGMLTAIDTLRVHAQVDPLTARTVALIERGLLQIRDIVGALLVQARLRGEPLRAADLDDVRILVTPQAQAKSVALECHCVPPTAVSLPATMVRQVLINLLLNAVNASDRGGLVRCSIEFTAERMRIDVRNGGRLLSDEQMQRLFEPFVPSSSGGHGLGLWVTYQIVEQLGGRIAADRIDGTTRFVVELPIGESR